MTSYFFYSSAIAGKWLVLLTFYMNRNVLNFPFRTNCDESDVKAEVLLKLHKSFLANDQQPSGKACKCTEHIYKLPIFTC